MKVSTQRFISWCTVVPGALLLVMGLWFSYEHHALLEEGVQVEAKVLSVEAIGKRGQQTFNATLELAESVGVQLTMHFTQQQAQSKKAGDTLTLLYRPSHPDNHYFGTREQALELGGRDQLSIYAGAALVLAGLFGVWSARPRRNSKRRPSAKTGSPTRP